MIEQPLISNYSEYENNNNINIKKTKIKIPDWLMVPKFVFALQIIPAIINFELLYNIWTYFFWNMIHLSASKSAMSIFLPYSMTFGCLRDISQPTWLKKNPKNNGNII